MKAFEEWYKEHKLFYKAPPHKVAMAAWKAALEWVLYETGFNWIDDIKEELEDGEAK